MRRISLLLLAVVFLLFTGCASGVRDCPAGLVCPASVVSGFFPATFKVDPDTLRVPDARTIGVVWSLADPQSRFYVDSGAGPQDGVEFTGFDGGGFKDVSPCFATDDESSPATQPARKYLCVVWSNSPAMTAKYKLRFHDGAGVQRTVDPAMTNTGDGRILLSAVASPLPPWQRPVTSTVLSCNSTASCQVSVMASAAAGGATVDPSTLSVAASGPGLVITWTLQDAGAIFDYGSPPRDGITWEHGGEQSVTPCWVTDRADGPLTFPPVIKGRYFRCGVSASGSSFSENYQISFHDKDQVIRTASGTVARP